MKGPTWFDRILECFVYFVLTLLMLGTVFGFIALVVVVSYA